jgi:alpha-glucosidase
MIKIKFIPYLMIGLVLLAEQGFSQNITLASPNENLKISFSTGNSIQSLVSYNIFNEDQPVLNNALIAFDIREISSAKFFLSGIKKNTAFSSWLTVYGERKSIPDNYNQVFFNFKSPVDTSIQLTITCRAYNEGFAFQYRLVQKGKTIILNNESSTFELPGNAMAWVSSVAQSPITAKKINEITGQVERPLTVRIDDDLFIALGEASLVNFARMKFTSNGQNTLATTLYGEVKSTDSLVSPWRYVLVGKSPADLLEKNYLLLNLNEPNQIANTDWIQPGKVLRESTLTTVGSFLSIDFAAKHNIRYICFDAGWYGKEDSDSSDATRVSIDPPRFKGPLDLQKVIAYGKQKNVGVILYVNRRALERQLDTLLPLYQSWGVKGLKFGFVQVGSQQWTNWLHEAVRKAAKYKMIVDVHDEYRPTGYSRTYPNLLTQEGVRGDEESPFTEHSITTIFTRSIAGAADITNCYFTNRVDKMGSHAAQLAKAVCVYSPLQFLFWYDRPVADSLKRGSEGEIKEVAELAWYDALPTVWDDTKVLESDMENFATIARKSGDSWFVGSLNGVNPRTINLTFDFLDKDKEYKAIIYTDDSIMNTATNVKITTMNIDHRSNLSFNIAERNGIAIHISSL